MVEIGRLSKCFETLQEETLPALGVADTPWARIIAARLLIERLGERDANYWWDSQVLGSFGSDTLSETVPRTSARAQVSLATAVGKKTENETINSGNAVSLFDLGPFVESRIQREIESIEGDRDLTELESLSIEINETGWTDSVFEVNSEAAIHTNGAHELGSVDVEDLEKDSVREDVISQLIAGYGSATKHNLVVPYYSIKS